MPEFERITPCINALTTGLYRSYLLNEDNKIISIDAVLSELPYFITFGFC